MQKFNIPHNFEVSDVRLEYAKWIKEGSLKVNSDWNKDLKIKFTLQDPCQFVRKTFGQEAGEAMRYAIKKVVGEENFVDMTPNMSNNYCCGGGGGFLQVGEPEKRREYGKLKWEQIEATGATYCIAPCHNCHAQIHDLSDHFGGGKVHVVHFWTLICLSMGILGENERVHLGPDLQNFGLEDED